MTVLNHPPPKSVDEYMQRERELGVWSYPHFVRYLRAIIYKLTPQPHHSAQMVLDAAAEILSGRCAPRRLTHLATTPPYKPGRGQAAREAANAICEVIDCWVKCNDNGHTAPGCSDIAIATAKSAERTVLAAGAGFTIDDLYQCAVVAHSDSEIDANRRDAAIAAMSAGHFKLAHEIVTDTPSAEELE